MRVVVTRVKSASVSSGFSVSSIGNGLLVLVGFTSSDSYEIIDRMVKKVLNLRIFNDDDGVMNRSVLDVSGEILSVSQFTLYGDVTHGNRPNYMKALNSASAKDFYDYFNRKLCDSIHVSTGFFGEHMSVTSVNDGPVTIIIDM